MTESFFWRRLIARGGLGRWLPGVRRAMRGGEDVLPLLSDRLLATPLADLLDPALFPDINTPDSINLALGSPRCELPPMPPRASADRRPAPAGDPELRAEIAGMFRREHGVEHDPDEEILVTHGATGAFAAVLDAFVNPGDRVVLFDPSSPLYSIGLKHRRASVAWVPTTSADGFVRFFSNDLTTAMRGAKLIVLADPSNPTGAVFAPEDLEQITFWARKNNTLIIEDSSYDRWRNESPRIRLANLPRCEGRIITLGSFAKSHGLESIRVGWLAGDRRLVRPCLLSASLNAPFVAPICQQMATRALRAGDSDLPAARAELNTRREYVAGRLRAMGLLPWPARAGFFQWTPVPPGETSRAFAGRLLAGTGVLVNPGEVFGPSGHRFVRISLATDEGRLREGLARLEGFVRGGSSVSRAVSGLAAGGHAVQ